MQQAGEHTVEEPRCQRCAAVAPGYLRHPSFRDCIEKGLAIGAETPNFLALLLCQMPRAQAHSGMRHVHTLLLLLLSYKQQTRQSLRTLQLRLQP